MTVRWVDFTINTPLGGLAGTTDTTTRNGTYAAPFALSDLLSNTSTPLTAYNGVTLADGDEIRFKGAALADYKTGSLDAYRGSDSHFHSFSDFDSAMHTILNATANGQPLVVDWNDGVLNNALWVVNTDGYSSDGSTDHTIQVYDHDRVFDAFQSDGTEATCTLSLIDADYIIDWDAATGSASAAYFAHTTEGSSLGLTYTAGWTSETVRGGVTILTFDLPSTSAKQFYWCDGNAGPHEWDCPELSVVVCARGSTYGYFSDMRLNMGQNYGVSDVVTHKLGSYCPGRDGNLYMYAGQGATNGAQINEEYDYIYAGAYIHYIAGDLTIRNRVVQSYHQTNLQGAGPYTFKHGTTLRYSSSASNYVGDIDCEILDNAYLFSDSSQYPYAVMAHGGASITLGSGVKTSLTGFTGPATNQAATLVGKIVPQQALPSSYKMNNGATPLVSLIDPQGVLGAGSARTALCTLNAYEADFGGDYQTQVCQFAWAPQSVSGRPSLTSADSLIVDNMLFQTNDHDGKAIIAAGNVTAPNDPVAIAYESGTALIIQSNSLCDNNFFNFGIPQKVPAFTTEDIRITINSEAVGGWTGTTTYNAVYHNASGKPALTVIGTESGGAAADHTATITNANIGAIDSLLIVVEFQSDDAESKRLQINSITIEAV